MRTAGTVLTLIDFLRPAIAFHRFCAQEKEFFVVRTAEKAVLVHREVDGPEGIIPILLV